eukprot:5894793-Alexandrium_andersonii.AAC.1
MCSGQHVCARSGGCSSESPAPASTALCPHLGWFKRPLDSSQGATNQGGARGGQSAGAVGAEGQAAALEAEAPPPSQLPEWGMEAMAA